jgi:hypothetical protein
MSGACDYCSSAKALVFCRADSARLCLACDEQVRHARNARTDVSRRPESSAAATRLEGALGGNAAASTATARDRREMDAKAPIVTDTLACARAARA